MTRVFLSYCTKDKPLAEKIAEDLRAAGIDIWFDEWNIHVGNSISQMIQKGLENVEFVAVLLTSNSVRSGWVEKEWQSKVGQEAQSKKSIILPLKADDCKIPPLLADKKYADFSENYGRIYGTLLSL